MSNVNIALLTNAARALESAASSKREWARIGLNAVTSQEDLDLCKAFFQDADKMTVEAAILWNAVTQLRALHNDQSEVPR